MLVKYATEMKMGAAPRAERTRSPLRIGDENQVIRVILQGTATHTGARFFEALVENLARALGTYSAWVTEYLEETRQMRSLAFWVNGRLAEGFRLNIDGTPCAAVVDSRELVHFPENVLDLYPGNAALHDLKAVSYLGAPLLDDNRRVLGNLAVLDRRPMPREHNLLAIFQVFANRASAELQRVRAERALAKSEQKYRRIVETTGQGFLLLDQRFRIADVNKAFCRLVGHPPAAILGRSPLRFAGDDFRRFLATNQDGPLAYRLRAIEGTLLTKSGRTLPVRINGDVLQDDDGRGIGFMYFISDITPQKRSLQLAAEVQRNLLPKRSPPLTGIDLAGRTLSCEEIGGDYFDYLPSRGCAASHLDIAVGDVCGHGVEAALLMATSRALLRAQVSSDACRPIPAVVTALNRQLALDVSDSGRFMTLFYLRIDLETRHLRWVRAGHPAALFFDPRSGSFRELGGQGMALGVASDWVYTEEAGTQATAGILAIATDGLWEARDKQQRSYGQKRLRDVIRIHAALGAEAIIDKVYADLADHSLGVLPEDDITLVIVKFDGGEDAAFDYHI
ncbi:MAG: SpoIIE family protein phosphatase [Desulfobacteraceae bacterium]|nr:SpoIIE family protein phosphatase [Desulfobacteraceae bacterium]